MSKPQEGSDDRRLDAELRAWAECTGSMLSRHRLDGTFTYVSPACRAVLGWEPEEIVGRKLKSLLHPDDALMMVAEFGQLPAHERPASATFRLLRKDGTHLWVEVTAGITTSATDGSVEIISVLRDVSDRRSVDNLVRRAQEILPALFDRLPVVIVFLDPEGQVDYVNRYCEALFGWPLEDLRRPAIWQQMYADAETRARIQTWARQPAKEIVDVRTRTKAGASVVIRWAGVKLGDGGSIAIGVDISERIAAEEALRESETRVRHLNQQLLAADQRKNEFLAMLAHELRNPLAPIANAVEALIRRGTDDAELTRACDLIREKVRHLVRLVDDLLDASRLDNDVIRIELADCEIGDVLREAVSTSRPLFERAGHRLSVDLGATPLWLRGDRIRLVQAFSNLLNNAATFTPPGGEVSLSVASEGDFAVVRVRDSGLGITAELLPRIFDLFVRGERPHGAMGVGLWLVRSIVERHGGSVEAHSEGAGRGSELVVRLPALTADEIAATDAGPPQAELALATRRVLVVDDDPAVAEGLAMLLEAMGQEVRVVHDGAAALAETARFDPEIVFVDISMPGMDGYETARRLRALPGGEHRHLIALTGFGLETVEPRLRAAGFDRYLAKPARADDLDRILG